MSTERLKIFVAKNGIMFALIALIAVFSILRPNFLSFANGQSMLLQAAELGVIAIPAAFLIMSGTIDLSVGSIASASAVTAGKVMGSTDSALIGILVAVGVGLLAGAINGFLVAYLRLNSFVVTLGSLSMWSGFALSLTGGETISRTSLPEGFRAIGTMKLGPVPLQIVLLVLVIACGSYVLNRTAFGKSVKAIGGNERAAHLMGVSVNRTRFVLFLASGALASVVGLLLTAKVQSADPNVGSGLELSALTVVLLGGVAFEGGVGRISGVVAGLLFFRVLRTGLVFMQASPFLQTILIGATLILAVALDSSIQRIIRSSWAELGRKAADQVSSSTEDALVQAGEPAHD